MSSVSSTPRSGRPTLASEEQRVWLAFYRRVRHDAAIAAEVLAQLEADAELKRAHLALYLTCKESLRLHKARQARNRRVGQFIRWLACALVVHPVQACLRALHRSADLAMECLPQASADPATAQVRTLLREREFAQAATEFDPAAGQLPQPTGTPRPRRAAARKAA